MVLTKFEVKALRILARLARRIPAGWFARECWPNSPSWRGSSIGRGVKRSAGKCLQRMARKGLVCADWIERGNYYLYSISTEGKEALDNHAKT